MRKIVCYTARVISEKEMEKHSVLSVHKTTRIKHKLKNVLITLKTCYKTSKTANEELNSQKYQVILIVLNIQKISTNIAPTITVLL